MATSLLTWRGLRADLEACGSHYFDRDTMRFFRSRTCGRPYMRTDGTVFFVTSERCPWGPYPRLYSVRSYVAGSGSVATVGEFQQYRSRNGAIRAAQRLARGEATDDQ